MTKDTIILLLLGSFLPNNLLIWTLKKLTHPFYKESRKFKLISPRRYYQTFESDPKTQYKYHKRMQKFWMCNFIPMNTLVAVDIWCILTPGYTKYGVLLNAIILAVNTNYSAYANWDTETGDAHAAYASIRTDELRQTTLGDIADQVDDMSDDLDDVHKVVEVLHPDLCAPEPEFS